MKRRDFIKLGTGGAAALSLGGLMPLLSSCSSEPAAPPAPDPATPQRLKIPSVISGGNMTAARTSVQIWEGEPTTIFGINGSIAPTIRVRKGDTFAATFNNALNETSIIHWHGLRVPSDMDGHPHHAITSGSFDYQYPVIQRAGTYWYHPHPDKRTGKQTYLGLAGAYIVSDIEEEALGLPSGKYDLPLIIQDRNRKEKNVIEYTAHDHDRFSGFLTSQVTVNQTARAYHEVERTMYRLRLINASNARVYNIGFEDGRPMTIIATDGGLIEAPVEVTQFWLSPAERVDIVVDFSADAKGGKAILKGLEYPFVSTHAGKHYAQGLEMQILEFRVNAEAGATFQVPSTLSSIGKLTEAQAVKTQNWEFTMDHTATYGAHRINGLVFSPHRIDYTIKKDDVELWEFTNTGDGFHGMHVHGTFFQVLRRSFGPSTELQPTDLGWKDTVLVWPHETVQVLVRFTDYKGMYMLHCHTLEHEDDGMMLNIEVV